MKKNMILLSMGALVIVLSVLFIMKNQGYEKQTVTYAFLDELQNEITLMAEIPKSYTYEIDQLEPPSIDWEGTPDWGIMIYPTGSHADYIYLFSSRSAHSFEYHTDYDTAKKMKPVKINGRELLLSEVQGRVLGYLSPYEEFGIVLNIGKEVYQNERKKILQMIKSAKAAG